MGNDTRAPLVAQPNFLDDSQRERAIHLAHRALVVSQSVADKGAALRAAAASAGALESMASTRSQVRARRSAKPPLDVKQSSAFPVA